MYRAEIVTNCRNCAWSVDWGSAGVECAKTDPNRLIAKTPRERTVMRENIPGWCPLPKMDYVNEEDKNRIEALEVALTNLIDIANDCITFPDGPLEQAQKILEGDHEKEVENRNTP